ncbi:MAG: RNA polymerase sigma factor [Pseudomonadota bacterium]|nr:RNA polymerase sigma factor [Pseudomonadota bacterium]
MPLFLHKAGRGLRAERGGDRVASKQEGPAGSEDMNMSLPAQARQADENLMARIAAGDATAFEEIVGTRLQRVLAVSRRMLGDDAEAEDVSQEALLRLWRQAGKWEGGRALISTWLYRVAVNLCVDRLRARKERATDELPEIAAPADQERGLQEEELKDFVDQALQALPERQRTAIVLFHHEELAMNDVAELMETSVEAVESLLARGRRALKQKLEPAWKQHLPERQD